MIRYAFVFILLLFQFSCSFKGIHRHKDITYMEEGFLDNLPKKELNIFTPKKANGSNDVMVFIHGGSWNSGDKDIYNFLGSRFARKGIVTVIINYPLAPEYQVHDMAQAAAKAVHWTKENISEYGGSAEHIYVSGHSAGGHLAALLTVRDSYFDTLEITNPIKGAVLIDAAGLDMYWFLNEMNYEPGTSYLKAFTDNPTVWKDTSPINFLDDKDPPLFIMIGGRTLPGIEKTTVRFMDEYKKIVPNPHYHLQPRKKHTPMIAQFLYTPNKTYRWISEFMDEQRD
jgi:acetyl esterase/lipase